MSARDAAVSVVIPCFQSGATILRAFESIVNQTLRPREVIFVDDASSDETPQILKDILIRHPEVVRIILLDQNVGAASARNMGWDAARQPYIAFLDADDSWHPSKLELQYEFMEKNPEVSVSAHLCDYYERSSHFLPPRDPLKLVSISPVKLLFKNYFSTPTVMLRRELPLRFEAGKRYAEDLQLWQSIAYAGHKIMRIEVPLAYIHKAAYGEAGLSSNLLEMEKGELINIIQLYKARNINAVIFLFAFVFSLLKFLKRIINFCYINLKRKILD